MPWTADNRRQSGLTKNITNIERDIKNKEAQPRLEREDKGAVHRARPCSPTPGIRQLLGGSIAGY
jgi:hypothetical protein